MQKSVKIFIHLVGIVLAEAKGCAMLPYCFNYYYKCVGVFFLQYFFHNFLPILLCMGDFAFVHSDELSSIPRKMSKFMGKNWKIIKLPSEVILELLGP